MTITALADFRLSPEIVLGRTEHTTLIQLAMAGTGHTADDADELLYELERAIVVAEGFVPPDVVRMDSTVTFESDLATRTVQLVYPKDADIAEGKVSVLTPIGTALIGLRTGQSMTWRTRANRRQALTVLRVIQEPGEPQPPVAA